MIINVSLLPSGGYGYKFPSINVEPMDFIGITHYLENCPKDDELGKYIYDYDLLCKDDRNVRDLYIMDIDFLMFYKKLITVSEDLKYQIEIKCPKCGASIKKVINFETDIHFKQADSRIMNGARINLGEHKYETIVPTGKDFIKVLNLYTRYRKIADIKMIKTIALIQDFETMANQVENDVLHATHSDITLLMALRDVYYNRLEPVQVVCPECTEEGGSIAVSVESLTTDFFRDLFVNCPIDGSKILFK